MLYYLGIITAILLIVLLFSSPLYFWEGYSKRKNADRYFAGREPLSDSAFYSRYFRKAVSRLN